jgi:hypothetical protein
MKMTALIVLTAALSAGCATAPSSDWSQIVRSDRGYFGPGAPVQASMWADEGGSATDVRAVIEHVRAVVAERTGHLMRSEVRLVGFPDVPPDDHRGVTW